MENSKHPISIVAAEAPPKTKSSNYPEPFYSRMNKREKRPLGDLFNLTNYGVNLTRLAPEGVSALRHAHSRQDEFVYILQGEPTLITNAGETILQTRDVRWVQSRHRRRPPTCQSNQRRCSFPRDRRP